MSLTIVILVAALFLGTAASAGLTPQAKTQTMNKKESNSQTTAQTGIASSIATCPAFNTTLSANRSLRRGHLQSRVLSSN